MKSKKQLSMEEFAQLTGMKQENLQYYDSIGLLSPELQDENNYRCYSKRQLGQAYFINSLRGMGLGSEEIKQYALALTPEKTLALFARQEECVQAKIKQLQETSLLLRMYTNTLREAPNWEEGTILLQVKKREPIFLCSLIPEGMGRDAGGIASYEYAEQYGINPGFPMGSMIAWNHLEQEDASHVDRYYFKTGKDGNAWKPAGRYVVAYGKCDPQNSEKFYQRIFAYIREQDLIIRGNAYEEYPLGDIIPQEVDQYCIRVEIRVN